MNAQANTPALLPAPTRHAPPYLLSLDVYILLSNLLYLLNIVIPLRTRNPAAELYPFSLGNISSILLGLLLLLGGLLSLLLIPAWLFLPGGVWLFWFTAAWAGTWFGARCLNGDQDLIVSSGRHVRGPGGMGREKWLYVNGVMAGSFWLATNVEEIERRFGRRVTGVHNRSYGLLLDLLQCLVQRDLRYSSACIRSLYGELRTALLELAEDDELKNDKVVLLAHSQGALIASLVLDLLYADIPASLLARLEVYTFGNAANSFNNPLLNHADRNSGVLRYLEHYANRGEYVSRIGILGFMPGGEVAVGVRGWGGNQFAGKVLVRESPGHLFVQHYLDVLFDGGFVEVRGDEGGERGEVGRLLGYRDGEVVN